MLVRWRCEGEQVLGEGSCSKRHACHGEVEGCALAGRGDSTPNVGLLMISRGAYWKSSKHRCETQLCNHPPVKKMKRRPAVVLGPWGTGHPA